MKYMTKVLSLVSLIALIGCSTAPEQKPFRLKIDKYVYVKDYMNNYIKEQMDSKNIIGLSIAMVDGKKAVWQAGFGYADKVKGVKATSKTIYRTASISKTFTCMAIMQLVEKGKINLDTPIKHYLPNFKFKNYPNDIKKVTVRMIMTHHSGIPNISSAYALSDKELSYNEVLDKLSGEYLTAPVDTIYNYSSLAIALLGKVIENVSGESYEKYMKDYLLLPLGMVSSKFQTELEGNNISKFYNKNSNTPETRYQKVSLPTMGLTSNVIDLSRFLMMIHNKGSVGKKHILKQKSLEEMMKVQNRHIKLDVGKKVGLGWDIDEQKFGKKFTLYSRIGVIDGYKSYIVSMPRLNLGIVILANTNTDISNIRDIANKAMVKMWELKTNKTYVPKKLSKLNIEEYDIAGVYNINSFGKVVISKKNNGYVMTQPTGGGDDLFLKKSIDNSYVVKKSIFDIFSPDMFGNSKFYFTKIKAKKVIVMESAEGLRSIVGLKLDMCKLPSVWKDYLGKYKAKEGAELILRYKEGYLERVWEYNGNEVFSEIFRPINNHEAIVEGLNSEGRILLNIEKDRHGRYILSNLGIRFLKENI